ncbi:AtpZ/AtpI family protein [Mucisphaera calidilacus]|uniref:F0F1-ATPase subunit (ATPase_gene1) n=1 Tax=Mucisphaera calidilacus TaxID=2527982 RepID=A0A518BZ54_9BACT|nr:AtpZ/AtpI family protein [Mucisphaera calidilacus]QDU72251.1 Putative F0F1-ATPase subunit (ATPase_gene1) [Mucisphaera calidilacus]
MAEEDRRRLWALAGSGLEFGLAAVVLAGVGFWLDGHWGTRPLWSMTGLVVGVMGGLYLLVKKAIALNQEAERDRRHGEGGGGDG